MKKNTAPDSFEEKLRELPPLPSNNALRDRIEASLGEKKSPASRARTAALIGFATLLTLFFIAAVSLPLIQGESKGAKVASPPDQNEKPMLRSRGQEQFLLSVSEPSLVELPDSAPVWEIQLQILNKAFLETQSGHEQTIFVPENRTVFVPAVYR